MTGGCLALTSHRQPARQEYTPLSRLRTDQQFSRRNASYLVRTQLRRYRGPRGRPYVQVSRRDGAIAESRAGTSDCCPLHAYLARRDLWKATNSFGLL